MAKIESGNLNELMELINDIAIPEALIEISPKLIDIYKKNMMETVYSKAPSKNYNRTYDAYNSIDADVKKEAIGISYWILKIFPNTKKMKNKYSSQPYDYPISGSDNREDIVGWINNRKNGGIYKGVPMQPTDNNFVEKTYIETDKKLKGLLKTAFNKLGYKTFGR